jgi:medium-chain acyl-[acyl-carrier-protein] hydrolase
MSLHQRGPNPWAAFWRHPPDATRRVFCFPYAGGSASAFRDWSDYLPRSVAVCPIQLPGRWNRMHEPPLTDLRTLLDALVPALRDHLDLPFVFFGHSMGALVAFELARELRRRYAREPEHLFVSGRRAPHLPDDDPPLYDLPAPEFIEALRELQGTPRGVLENAELMALLTPVLRSDFRICQTYVFTPEPPLTCPITAFGGVSDPEVSQERLDAWERHTTAAFARHLLPGDHFFLQTAQPLLLRLIAETLAALDASPRLA